MIIPSAGLQNLGIQFVFGLKMKDQVRAISRSCAFQVQKECKFINSSVQLSV